MLPPEHRRLVITIAVSGLTFCIALAAIGLLMR
jgi:hypothetical protein